MLKIKLFFAALWAALKTPLTYAGVWFASRRQARLEYERAQKQADLEALKRGIRAGDAVKHDARSVSNDKYNRDTRDGV